MSERTLQYNFNTAITGVNEEDGKFDEDAHRQLVLPLRGRLMQYDGICGLYIARFRMKVKYITGVTTPEEVDEAVNGMIQWASEREGLFPLCGSMKVPKATREIPESPKPSRFKWVLAYFNTNVVGYTPSAKEEGFDSESFRSLTHSLVTSMTDTDGVVGWQLKLSSAALKYDSEITTREAIEAHMRSVFHNTAAVIGGAFFPYLNRDAKKLVITFDVDN